MTRGGSSGGGQQGAHSSVCVVKNSDSPLPGCIAPLPMQPGPGAFWAGLGLAFCGFSTHRGEDRLWVWRAQWWWQVVSVQHRPSWEL